MKIVSFNINGLRARLHQLQAIIDKHQPDIIGLQEIKVHDEAFPREEVEAMGYHVAFHGQKAHYGVAILSKQAPLSVEKGFPGDDEEAQRRMIMASFQRADGAIIKVMNGYFPQGENQAHETKFPAKTKFYADLQAYLETHHNPGEQLVIIGDMNISPTDRDIGIGEANRKRWLKEGKCSFLPIEREWLARLLGWGLTDTFRAAHPDESERFSWFDYRSRGFDDNRGLRIDLILASDALKDAVTEVGIDYELRGIEKPSDHAPIWATFA
ncbi:exodeoxyribonuclease III [Aeromonas simiae]|uniref:exodeoxyribonuclease III n=1 Tax=Aeromonas simiae TaxID=218936 RepID=UPI00266CFA3F|nr:exodeoxyribonuclease III [Aeromonas simiae]MDO2947391.1 exodeoxyribonuclease III [Aeromonas simiae]MDO2951060.1 exodeoxyribonuclease III [Aeromonas simiae]MDO2954653.1 exodeoxyribonuclease III [Aeromonas simiae]